MKLKIPPALLLVMSIGLMWLIGYLFPLAETKFSGITYIAAGFIVVGSVFVVAGLWEFYRSSTTVDPHKIEKVTTLVDTGIYRISRNPMYVGVVSILTAAVFYLGNLLTLLVVPVFIWYMNQYQIIPEEQMMEEKFGEEYRAYKKRVRRWL